MSKVQPLDFLKETKKQIDAHIFDFLPSAHDHPEVHQFYQMMLDYPLRAASKGYAQQSVYSFVRHSAGTHGRLSIPLQHLSSCKTGH